MNFFHFCRVFMRNAVVGNENKIPWAFELQLENSALQVADFAISKYNEKPACGC